MADLLVSRIQNRRGRQVDLPQPLRPGEFGWCVDTARLFIGGNENETPAGVQVFPDYYVSAQSIIDNQMLVVDVSGVGSFDLATFKAYMGNAANLPNAAADITPTAPELSEDNIQFDSVNELVYIGFSVAQSDSGGGVGSAIDDNADGYQVDIAAYDAGITVGNVTQPPMIFTIDTNGTFSMALATDHEAANAVATLLNVVSGIGMASTRLNIEVLTEFSEADEDMLFEPATFILPPSGAFTSFPAPTITYSLGQSDTIVQEFSIHLDNNPDYYNGVGKIYITASIDGAQTETTDEITYTETSVGLGTIEFRSVIAGSTVELQYKHSFATSITFKAISRRWLSF